MSFVRTSSTAPFWNTNEGHIVTELFSDDAVFREETETIAEELAIYYGIREVDCAFAGMGVAWETRRALAGLGE